MYLYIPLILIRTGGSAAHTHISVHPIDSNKSSGLQAQSAASDNLTPLERIFLAGLLDHLPAACAFTLPIRASYARMLDGIWSGGTWVSWGENNRETPIRLCVPPTRSPARPEPASPSTAPTSSGNHFEVRCVDGTSSPYLAFSSLLGAGLLGIQSQAPLIEKDCRMAAAKMTEEERKAVGVMRRLPRTWEEARSALERDEALRGLLGDVVGCFLNLGGVSHLLAAFVSDANRVDRLWMTCCTPLRPRQGKLRSSSRVIELALELLGMVSMTVPANYKFRDKLVQTCAERDILARVCTSIHKHH